MKTLHSLTAEELPLSEDEKKAILCFTHHFPFYRLRLTPSPSSAMSRIEYNPRNSDWNRLEIDSIRSWVYNFDIEERSGIHKHVGVIPSTINTISGIVYTTILNN